MSIELPEATILAEQMNKELRGKRVKSSHLQDFERLQRIGMLNKDIKDFNNLVEGKIEFVASRGNVIHVKLNNGTNLILDPEYGGEIFYHTSTQKVAGNFHLKVDFDDGTVLTVRLTGMGVIQVMKDNELERSYVYRRDFNYEVPSPTDEEFTFDRFSRSLVGSSRMLKSVLVGKDAIVVGLSNSAFHDILFGAKLHPMRKGNELNKNEVHALYDSIKAVIEERLRLGGKDKFYDLYRRKGGYTPAMGPNMKEQTCRVCGTPIDKISMGGGDVYFCPKCQK